MITATLLEPGLIGIRLQDADRPMRRGDGRRLANQLFEQPVIVANIRRYVIDLGLSRGTRLDSRAIADPIIRTLLPFYFNGQPDRTVDVDWLGRGLVARFSTEFTVTVRKR